MLNNTFWEDRCYATINIGHVLSLQIVNVFKEILKQNLKRIVNKHSGYIFAEKYFFLIHFRKKNVNVIVNDVKGLTTRYKRLVIFEVAHCATWQNPLKKCCFSKNISKTHLNVGVLFDKRSMIKIQLSDGITVNRN